METRVAVISIIVENPDINRQRRESKNHVIFI